MYDVREVAETREETARVALLVGADVIYVAKVTSTHAVRTAPAAVERVPADGDPSTRLGHRGRP
ncbi:hypothetical protein A6A06_28140 [Streptomyces sp. CB02923]|nr:hypothetical protein A6A06_28140 [Streptomyces sp. CB02923]